MLKHIESTPVKVLIVDDSSVVRSIVAGSLRKDPRIEIVGTATDPYDARDQILQKKPDVITLDVEMPKMDGLTFLKLLMERHPIPVILLSSISTKGSQTALDALQFGAIEVLAKPDGPHSLGPLLDVLGDKIVAAAQANFSGRRFNPKAASLPQQTHSSWQPWHPKQLILLGASTGGTEALREVLQFLPAPAPPILIVQHIPAHFSRAFADRLNTICPLNVKEAEDGEAVLPGKVLIAPGNWHMTLLQTTVGMQIRLLQAARVWYQRPSVDVLFKSAVPFAPHVIAGLMTGMGKDGAQGLLSLRTSGAQTFIQDELSCVVYGMPKAAADLNAAEAVLPLNKIAGHLLNAVRNVNVSNPKYPLCT